MINCKLSQTLAEKILAKRKLLEDVEAEEITKIIHRASKLTDKQYTAVERFLKWVQMNYFPITRKSLAKWWRDWLEWEKEHIPLKRVKATFEVEVEVIMPQELDEVELLESASYEVNVDLYDPEMDRKRLRRLTRRIDIEETGVPEDVSVFECENLDEFERP